MVWVPAGHLARVLLSWAAGPAAPAGGEGDSRPLGSKAGEMAGVDEQGLFTEGCLLGLRAKLCADVDALDRYLPSQAAALVRKVAGVLRVP
ncbi:hypothetical protein M2163_000002 [Streptomyces sp. SAI-135]|uniref:hypothetical protein n=1 Tax=unclassified Streptomyces TaxID=2593676 RepID=UPI0024740860|nr:MULTISPECIES: hypothetical protein [unclassified Streptomyces]MDH6522506.1 hypothetical protein [Streptomyces sp. SAI-090]MDH6523493.1 hypothetical protein [Streptomyces sp. SAI-090]MDH6564981.1 hypothetical protein [Streptomyces sp. SAI-117]MDH6574384.1 hypothetical protein [Streptomyces sp. SAI-117]MDH6612894.1 hypothetical protein [Streptomyces sp. SAI-135]